jgi:hypothetical protein
VCTENLILIDYVTESRNVNGDDRAALLLPEPVRLSTFYGINPKTFRVESVSVTRGGTLRKWGPDATFATHHLAHGRQAKSEIIIVWGLTDLIEIYPQLDDSESTKQKLAELKAKAEAKRAEHERDSGQ